MTFHRLVTDLALSAAAGYLATKAMEPVSMKLYQLEPDGIRAREDAARPGPPFRIAADKLSTIAGRQLDEHPDAAVLPVHEAFDLGQQLVVADSG